MNTAQLLLKCLENEGVKHIYGLPGEEIVEFLEAVSKSEQVQFILTRHEQSAAFMADVYGRLTGSPGVCLATLGPGATNLLTGVADAFLDRAPMVAITGQTNLGHIHKESHQYIDVLSMFRPVTKWNARIERPEIVPEVVRKAFKLAATEKPGATHIELPSDVSDMEAQGAPLPIEPIQYPRPNQDSVLKAAELLSKARSPIILAGNGVIRRGASPELTSLAETLNLPVTYTFMAKGCIDYQNHLSLMSIGLQTRDWAMVGLEQADVVITVGYDMVEYSPSKWNPDRGKKIIHIDSLQSEVDADYIPEVEIVGDIRQSLTTLREAAQPLSSSDTFSQLREIILGELKQYANDTSMPIKPQKVLADLRQALGPDDILVSDVGSHKLWVARMYPAQRPNTVVISNGFASMGISIPGAIAAKLAHPNKKVVAVVGDGAFMMNFHELETAKRLGLPFVVMVWVDGSYGMVEWNQRRRYGHSFGVHFDNPDFVQLAQSFGIHGFKPKNGSDLLPLLKQALELDTPSLIEIPIDYSQNQWLTDHMGQVTQAI